MTIYEYGNPDADTVLIQLTGDHELSVLKNEVEEIRKRTSTDFRLIAAKVDDWNYELSPWKAPAVFGNEDFGDGAVRTLEQILTLCTDKSRTYYVKESCSQDSPTAAGRFSDIIPLRRSAILPGGPFCVIGTLRSNFL